MSNTKEQPCKLKVVVLNAPSRVGKDVGASYLTKCINNNKYPLTAYHREFKHSLFKITADMLGISVEEFLDGYDMAVGDYCSKCQPFHKDSYLSLGCTWWKDVPLYRVGAKERLSKRQALIHTSENIIKPNFGDDAFGKMFVNNLPEEGVVFVSDGGFKEEILPIIDHVGKENLLIIRIHREGYDFSNDSRNYLTKEMFDKDICPAIIDLENNGTIEEFEGNLLKVYNGWEKQYE